MIEALEDEYRSIYIHRYPEEEEVNIRGTLWYCRFIVQPTNREVGNWKKIFPNIFKLFTFQEIDKFV